MRSPLTARRGISARACARFVAINVRRRSQRSTSEPPIGPEHERGEEFDDEQQRRRAPRSALDEHVDRQRDEQQPVADVVDEPAGPHEPEVAGSPWRGPRAVAVIGVHTDVCVAISEDPVLPIRDANVDSRRIRSCGGSRSAHRCPRIGLARSVRAKASIDTRTARASSGASVRTAARSGRTIASIAARHLGEFGGTDQQGVGGERRSGLPLLRERLHVGEVVAGQAMVLVESDRGQRHARGDELGSAGRFTEVEP